jgi:O-antigen ligase
MLMSGCSVFSVHQAVEQPGSFVSAITPGRLIGPFLLLRCAISPGLPTLLGFLGRLHVGVAVCMVTYFVPMFLVPIGVQWWNSLGEIGLTLVLVAIAIALLSQIRGPTWVVLAVVLALLLFPAYHVLLWIGVLEPNRVMESTFVGVEIMRTSAGRYDANYTGTALASLMSVLLLGFFLVRRRIVSWLCAASAGLSLMVLLETGSRAGALVALAGCFCDVVLAIRLRASRLPERLIILSMGVILLVGLASAQITSTIEGMLVRFSDTYVERVERDDTRKDIWVEGLDHIVANPLGNPREWWRTHSLETHQSYLMAGVEGGILSMLALVSISIISIWRGWQAVRFAAWDVAPAHGAMLLLLSTTALAMCSYAMLRHYLFWVTVVYFGMYAVDKSERLRNTPSAIAAGKLALS